MNLYKMITTIFMVAVGSYAVYGIITIYLDTDKVLWSGLFGLLFISRYLLKRNLDVGFTSISQEVESMSSKHRLFYYFHGACSFITYCASFMILFMELAFKPVSLLFAVIACFTIFCDVTLWSWRKKGNRERFRDDRI